MRMFLLGGYVVGAIATFIIVGFLAVLGGRKEDLWMPFVYAIGWPIYWAWLLVDLLR